MTTNTVCTILRTNENSYDEIMGVYPCMWQETEEYEAQKYGEENADKAAIYIPDLSADVRKGDYICRGEYHVINLLTGLYHNPDGTEELDIDKKLVVMSVTRHDYGSEDMRHIRIGAR